MRRARVGATRGRALVIAGIAVAVIGAALAWWPRDALRDSASASALVPVSSVAMPHAPSLSEFAGAAACQSCHAEQFAAWRTSTHGAAGGALTTVARGALADGAAPVRVIAPFDGTPIRFRDATIIPREAGGQFSFVVERAGERDTTLRVDAVIGGGHMAGGGTQGFVTAWPDGTLRFLPFDWSRDNQRWFCNTGSRSNRGWQPITPAMRLADCGDWPPSRVLGDVSRFSNCQSCHGSQIDLDWDSAGSTWVTRSNGFSINCESCHGPAARHVVLMRAGSAPTVDIGLPALATLSKDQSLAVCLSCHSLKARLAEQWRPGAPLSRFYAVRLAQLDDRPYTEDGRTRTFAYQEGHLASNCYRNGGMTCVSCHDPHTQHYRTVDGRPIPGRTNDGQCTGCHASKAVDPPAHTMHARNSAGSRCVSCHMPYEQQHELGRAIRYARSDHTIPIPRPVLDSSLGITSSCRTCHAEKTETQHAAQIARWWGALRPHEPAVAGLLAARGIGDGAAITPLLLQPDSRNVTAQVAGLARWLERVAEPDMAVLPADAEARLRALATSSDIDVRALALATLHFVRGNDAGTRRWLIAAITTQPGLSNDDQLGVPQRWAAVLGGVGDAARAANAPARAIIAYRKALEVASGDAALLLNLGLARAASGDVAGAVQSYQHSLRADQSRQSASARATSTVLAQVNLGIAFEQGGESEQAVRAYERAIVVDVTGPLGYLNLGTKRLRDGDAAAAIPMFERALARDPGLAVGHFQLALAYLKQGDRRRAAASVRRAIALDTTNADARQLAAALEEALKSQGR